MHQDYATARMYAALVHAYRAHYAPNLGAWGEYERQHYIAEAIGWASR
jgi:hypothetical protein